MSNYLVITRWEDDLPTIQILTKEELEFQLNDSDFEYTILQSLDGHLSALQDMADCIFPPRTMMIAKIEVVRPVRVAWLIPE